MPQAYRLGAQAACCEVKQRGGQVAGVFVCVGGREN